MRASNSRPRVYIVYSGGTIGMRRGPSGYAPAPGYLAERMAAMPELSDPTLPEYWLHEHDPLLDSSDMRPRDWERIARDIADNGERFDGFVVIHGTDTMAYTASALSFMLEGLDRPVILTGSQIPLAQARSDARENLITSMLLAASGPPEVAVYLGSDLLRGNRSTKVSSSGFEAFASPNLPPLARVGVTIEVDWQRARAPAAGALRARRLAEVDVVALRLFPGITPGILHNVLLEPVAGLVLETYGAGNAPLDDDLLAVVASATSRGVVVVNCSQCLRGRVDMSGYATGRALRDAGVTSGADMTAEAALTKLIYLFSCDHRPARVRELMEEDLRGELTPTPLG